MKTLFLIGTLAVLALAAPALAEEPELHISSKGEVRIVNAVIASRHSTNLVSVVVWGLKWVVPIDRTTKVESADGKSIAFSEVLDGHRLEIVGPAVTGDVRRPGWIDTRLIRDLSIGTPVASRVESPPPAPAPPSTSSGQAPLPQPAAIGSALAPPPAGGSPPPAVGAASSGKRLLTKNLRSGMRGGEVIILQEFLQKHDRGIPNDGPVTGFYGKVTVSAVKKFQAANGLAPEGEVGPKTRALINKLLSEEPL